MALSKKPVNGMKDILPAEMEIRDYVTSVIKDTYRSFGFTPIETPCMENIANLTSKQGGENEKLIFKVMKSCLLYTSLSVVSSWVLDIIYVLQPCRVVTSRVYVI